MSSLQSRAPVPLNPLLSESYVFDPRPHYPLLSTLKRFWNPSWTDSNSPDGLTLLFTHGTGFHKEQWETTIDYLLELIQVNTAGSSSSAQQRRSSPNSSCQNNSIKIREIWTIDAPNHGDAGVLNEKSLRNGYEPAFPKWQEYAHNIHAFLTGRGQTLLGTYSEDDRTVIPNFDFSNHHTIVCIGHSIGAISLLLSLDLAPSMESYINISSFIFIEPMIMPPTLGSFQDLAEKLASGSQSRRDVWPSAEEAYKMFKTRRTWQSWDDRVLKIFVDTGLRPLPTLSYPNAQHGSAGTPVTLKCTREQETATYREIHGWDRIYRNLPSYASRVRIHIYYGKIHDFIAKECKENVINTAAGGPQNYASIGFIDGAGHTAPQQKPRGVAEKIFEAIETDAKDRLKSDSFQAKL